MSVCVHTHVRVCVRLCVNVFAYVICVQVCAHRTVCACVHMGAF